ncbi:MAG: DNA polymerase I, partial [Hyphomonadaceae bacterium]|nr:DNA polymerase I [Clostridia bacterium]
MPKLIVFDGNSIANRAFYGIRVLTNREGQFTNAIYGFLNILFKFMDEEQPDYICVAFDLKAPTFRHTQYDKYKAQRKGMPEELASQMPVIKDVLMAMHMTVLQLEGYEADDIIGTVSAQCEAQGMLCTIVTGDKDAFQLVSDLTTVKLPVTKMGNTATETYNVQAVFDKYGVSPRQMIEVKGLMGDPSDNIPGVAGIGEKTALNLIQAFQSIEGVYQNIDHADIKKGVREKLLADREMADISRSLAEIHREVPLATDLTHYIIKPYDAAKLMPLLEKLELKTIIARVRKNQPSNQPIQEVEAVDILTGLTCMELNTPEAVKKLKISDSMTYKLHLEQHAGAKRIGGISIFANGNAYFIPIDGGFFEQEMIASVQHLFEDASIIKNGYDMKSDIVILRQWDIRFDGIGFDVMLAAYLLSPNSAGYPIAELAQTYLSATATNSSYFDVVALSKLCPILKKQLVDNEMLALYDDIELPLSTVLADMEIAGFKVDKKQLNEFSTLLEGKIKDLEFDITALAGESFNINSPKQLGVVLFEKLGLPIIKKTKTGYSTDVDVLEKLKDKHAIIPHLMSYRQLAKLKSTYADGLVHVIEPRTGKIHTSFNQTIAATGRISSTEPNLQNIPIRTELGRQIRKMFVASNDDYVLVDADYSQIELRVLAHIAHDPVMIGAFLNDEDIHRITASQVFAVPLAEVTSQMRSNAKAVNFGIVYGIGEFSLAEDLKISRKEAKRYIDSYLMKYEKVKQYMHDTVESAKEKGYVTTLLNRRRYIPELKSSNFNMRSFGERVAMNSPIQGTAADIIKIAMIAVHD